MIEIRKERACKRVDKFNVHSSFVVEYFKDDDVFALWFGSFETRRDQGGSHMLRERDNASMILSRDEMRKFINDLETELQNADKHDE